MNVKTIILLLSTATLYGCSADTKLIHSPSYLEVKESIEVIRETAENGEESIKASTIKLLPVVIQSGVVDDYYVDTEEFEKEKEVFLPDSFNIKTIIEMEGSVGDIVKAVTDAILNETGISIIVEGEDDESSNISDYDFATSDSSGDNMGEATSPQPGFDIQNPMESSFDDMDTKIPFYFEGSLKNLVKKVGLMKKMKWRYDRTTESVIYSASQTKVYTLPIFDHSSSFNVSVSSSASTAAGSNSGSTSASMSSSSESKPWEYIISGLTDIITNKGSFSINKETGTIEVTDSFINMKNIDVYIRNLIDLYSTQLLVDVRIVHLSDVISNTKEINWSTINNKIGSVVASANFGNPANISSAASLLLGYKKDPAAEQNNISAAINLLSTYAESYTVDSFSAITTNFRSVPIQLSSAIVYFDKEEQADDGAEGTRTTISYTATEKQIGTTITLTPSLIKDDINLSYVFQKTQVSSVEISPDGTNHPLTATKTFVQNVKLQNSIPLVISAINTSTSRNNSSSPLATGAWFLGGSEANQTKNTKDIVLVTVSKIRRELTDHKNTYFDDKIIPLSDYRYE